MSRAQKLVWLLPLLGAVLSAHDLYILPDAFRVLSGMRLGIAFHNGDTFPESEVAPPLARLLDAQLHSSGTIVSIRNLQVTGKRVVGFVDVPTGGGSAFLSVHTAPNLIELPSEKFLKYLKEEGLNNVISWRESHASANKPGRERYSKFAKCLLSSGASDDFYKQPIGFAIEIIPELDPATLHAGSQLPIRVLWRGKAAVGLQIEAAWFANGSRKTTIVGRAAADGRIRVPIAMAGKWRLHTLAMEPCAEPAVADWESSWASLTFEIR